MGGRGASSGSYKLHGRELSYGDEYETVFQYGDMKFVRGKMKESTKTAPIETMTRDRIYAFVNGKDELVAVVFFDENGKRYKQIDLKDHHGMGWHVQEGYSHDGPHRKMSKAERRTARMAMALWRNHQKRARGN